MDLPALITELEGDINGSEPSNKFLRDKMAELARLCTDLAVENHKLKADVRTLNQKVGNIMHYGIPD